MALAAAGIKHTGALLKAFGVTGSMHCVRTTPKPVSLLPSVQVFRELMIALVMTPEDKKSPIAIAKNLRR